MASHEIVSIHVVGTVTLNREVPTVGVSAVHRVVTSRVFTHGIVVN